MQRSSSESFIFKLKNKKQKTKSKVFVHLNVMSSIEMQAINYHPHMLQLISLPPIVSIKILYMLFEVTLYLNAIEFPFKIHSPIELHNFT